MMEKDNVYVVTYVGKPIGVYWDLKSAAKAVGHLMELRDANEDPAEPEDYFIHQVGMQSPWSWIVGAMSESVKQPVIPSQLDAFDWMVSEVGEAAGAKVASGGDWVRNNPEKHENDSFYWEIGQAIMMGILALRDTPVGIIKEQLAKWGYEDAEYVDDSQEFYNQLFKRRD